MNKALLNSKEFIEILKPYLSTKTPRSVLNKREVLDIEDLNSKFNELLNAESRILYYEIYSSLDDLEIDNKVAISKILEILKECLKSLSSDESAYYGLLKIKDYLSLRLDELERHRAFIDTTEDVKALQEKAQGLEEKIDKSRTEYVAILGIFAAIIMAFAGGFGLNAKFFETINPKHFNLYLCAFSLGTFGLFNLTTLLLYFCIKPRKYFGAFWAIINLVLIAASVYFYTQIN